MDTTFRLYDDVGIGIHVTITITWIPYEINNITKNTLHIVISHPGIGYHCLLVISHRRSLFSTISRFNNAPLPARLILSPSLWASSSCFVLATSVTGWFVTAQWERDQVSLTHWTMHTHVTGLWDTVWIIVAQYWIITEIHVYVIIILLTISIIILYW